MRGFFIMQAALIISLVANLALILVLAIVWISQRMNEERINRAEKDRDAAKASASALSSEVARRLATIKTEIEALEKLSKK